MLWSYLTSEMRLLIVMSFISCPQVVTLAFLVSHLWLLKIFWQWLICTIGLKRFPHLCFESNEIFHFKDHMIACVQKVIRQLSHLVQLVYFHWKYAVHTWQSQPLYCVISREIDFPPPILFPQAVHIVCYFSNFIANSFHPSFHLFPLVRFSLYNKLQVKFMHRSNQVEHNRK
jgi:hypothetical protein